VANQGESGLGPSLDGMMRAIPPLSISDPRPCPTIFATTFGSARTDGLPLELGDPASRLCSVLRALVGHTTVGVIDACNTLRECQAPRSFGMQG
jgi:hypothetical protein